MEALKTKNNTLTTEYKKLERVYTSSCTSNEELTVSFYFVKLYSQYTYIQYKLE